MDYLELRELYHHGIKGQKWGIRKYQNEDGSLTPAGRERYGINRKTGKMTKEGKELYKSDMQQAPKGSKTQSAFKTQKIEKYLNQGLTIDEANKKYSIRKKAAIGASVTSAILATYGTYKLVDYFKGGTIKKDQVIQRIAPGSEHQLHDTFYASVGKHDTKRYRALMPKHYAENGEFAFNRKIAANKNIKVASNYQAKKVYEELAKSNSFGKRYTSYDQFNRLLVDRNADSAKFYNRLKELGYGAIQDMNDKKYSGFNTRKPLIFFEGSSNFNIMKTSLADLDANLYNKEKKKMVAESLAKLSLVTAIPASTIASGKQWINSRDINYIRESR